MFWNERQLKGQKYFSILLLCFVVVSCTQAFELRTVVFCDSNPCPPLDVAFEDVEKNLYIQSGEELEIKWDFLQNNNEQRDGYTDAVEIEFKRIGVDSSWQPLTSVDKTQKSYFWQAPDVAEVAEYRFRLRASNRYKQYSDWVEEQSQGVILDNVPPTVELFEANHENNDVFAPFLSFKIQAKDQESFGKLTHLCVKSNLSSKPALDDVCWQSVAEYYEENDVSFVRIEDFGFFLGTAGGVNTVYVWVKDAAKNRSLEAQAINVTYYPKKAPVVKNVEVTPNGSSAPIDPTQTLTVLWKAEDLQNEGDAGLAASNPISIYYTLDEENYVLIAAGLENHNNGGCAIDDPDKHDGCYLWNPTGSLPADVETFRVRVLAKNKFEMIGVSGSPILNTHTKKFKLLAGNLDPGISASARGASFFIRESSEHADPGVFVVLNSGEIVFRDHARGILRISPRTGTQEILIPKTGESAGNGGPVSQATVRNPTRLALDFSGGILIHDHHEIRRINTRVNPWTIERVIGGGEKTEDNVSPLEVKFNTASDKPVLAALPNGDIYFQSENVRGNFFLGEVPEDYEHTPTRIRILTRSEVGGEPIVRSLAITDQDNHIVDQCLLYNFGFDFDVVTSEVKHFYMSQSRASGQDQVCFNSLGGWYRNVLLNSNGLAYHSDKTVFDSRVSYAVMARTGELYLVDKKRGRVDRMEMTESGYSRTRILGFGSSEAPDATVPGECVDGTLATECRVTPIDVFVSSEGLIYFVDAGIIRVIDREAKVRSLAGQSYAFGDEGNPASARFNTARDFGLWYDEDAKRKIVVYDLYSMRIREFDDETIELLAGNGNMASPNLTDLAKDQPIMTNNSSNTASNIVVDPEGGVYFNRHNNRVARLDRNSGKWVDIAGGGATDWFALSAEGKKGHQVRFNTGGNLPHMIGYGQTFNGEYGPLVVRDHYQESAQATVRAILMHFHEDGLGNWIFNKFFGLGGAADAAGFASLFSGDNPIVYSLADNNDVAKLKMRAGSGERKAHFDSAHGRKRWFVLGASTSSNIVELDLDAETLKFVRKLQYTAQAFTYAPGVDPGKGTFYYCSTGNFLYSHPEDPAGSSTSTRLHLPNGMHCEGRGLIVDENSHQLIFVFRYKSAITGVGAYPLN